MFHQGGEMWSEHGGYEFELKGQLLIMRPTGAWNYETAQRCCREYKDIAMSINNKPWACLVNLLSWEMGTPDIWPEIDRVNAWADEHNERFEAVVCSTSLQTYMLEQTYDKFKNVKSEFFDSEAEAIAWLETSLNSL